jgi:hypothetical protein
MEQHPFLVSIRVRIYGFRCPPKSQKLHRSAISNASVILSIVALEGPEFGLQRRRLGSRGGPIPGGRDNNIRDDEGDNDGDTETSCSFVKQSFSDSCSGAEKWSRLESSGEPHRHDGGTGSTRCRLGGRAAKVSEFAGLAAGSASTITCKSC